MAAVATVLVIGCGVFFVPKALKGKAPATSPGTGTATAAAPASLPDRNVPAPVASTPAPLSTAALDRAKSAPGVPVAGDTATGSLKPVAAAAYRAPDSEQRGKREGKPLRSARSGMDVRKDGSPPLPGRDDMQVSVRKAEDDRATTLYNKALREADRGNFHEAKRLYLAALAERPDNVETLNNLGVLFMREGAGREALFYFTKILDVRKDYGKAYNNIGLVLLGQGDKQQAAAYFRKAIEREPQSVEPYLNLSAILRSDRKLEEASQVLEGILKRGEKDPAVHLSYAIVKDESGRPQEAIPHYRYYLREAGGYEGRRAVIERLKVLEDISPSQNR